MAVIGILIIVLGFMAFAEDHDRKKRMRKQRGHWLVYCGNCNGSGKLQGNSPFYNPACQMCAGTGNLIVEETLQWEADHTWLPDCVLYFDGAPYLPDEARRIRSSN